MTRFDVIYAPKGPALEYSAWACNIVKSGQRGEGPKSCSHGCLYCYNPPGAQDGPVLKDNVLNRLKDDLKKLKEIIKRGERLEFTFVGDLYDSALDKVQAGVSRKCLEACKEVGISFQVLTKNGKDASKDFDLYGPEDLFGVTLTCDNDDDSLKWEPGAPLWIDRIESLKLAKSRNIKTWVSFEPVLDPEQTLHLIELVAPYADKIKVGKLNTRNNQSWHCDEIKELSRTISWEVFGNKAVALLEKLKKDYYIKADLAPFISKHAPRPPTKTLVKTENKFDSVPKEIKQIKHWVVWRGIKDNKGKIQKRPWRTDGVSVLTWGNPLNHLEFEEAKRFFEIGISLPERDGRRFQGIGFILPPGSFETRIVALDLDDAIKGGQVSDGALKLLKDCNSYSEISPSGKGIRIIGKAILPEGQKNISAMEGGVPLIIDGQKVEMFVHKHFFTITGNKLDDYPDKLEHITAQVLQLYSIKNVTKKGESKKNIKIDDSAKYQKYAETALENEIRIVRDTKETNRNNQLNTSAFAMGTLAATGAIDESEVRSGLIRAAVYTGLSPEESEKTFRSGFESGLKEPRDLPEDEGPTIILKKKSDPVPQTVHETALEILQNGDPIGSIVNSCKRSILGAETAIKKLCCCVAAQDVIQSDGLHPKMSGESGSGKTMAIMIFAHHLPSEAVLVGSMSNKAAFYHIDGDRLFRILDDYQAGNEDLDTIIKQTTSLFHEKYVHRTVINQKAATLQIGSEQTWAITSVDSSQDIQVLNRQIPINVDDSEILTNEINKKTIERYTKGQKKFPEDEEVEVCREMWRILREEGYVNIKVPFGDNIEWLDTSNRRNPSIFMDILIAHAAIMRHQRDIDSDGYYLATEDDFCFASDLFMDKEADELVKRLTKKERLFAELLRENSNGMTKKEVAEAMGISGQRVCQLAYGEGKKGGLVQKLPGFNADEIVDTINIDENEYGHATQKRSVKKTLFTLKGYKSLNGFGNVVRLRCKVCKDGVRT
jgi:hypothetical protein